MPAPRVRLQLSAGSGARGRAPPRKRPAPHSASDTPGPASGDTGTVTGGLAVFYLRLRSPDFCVPMSPTTGPGSEGAGDNLKISCFVNIFMATSKYLLLAPSLDLLWITSKAIENITIFTAHNPSKLQQRSGVRVCLCARNKLGTVLDPRIFIFPCFDGEPSNIGRKLIAQDEK